MSKNVSNVMMSFFVVALFGLAACGGGGDSDSSGGSYSALGSSGFKSGFSSYNDCKEWVENQSTGSFRNATCVQDTYK